MKRLSILILCLLVVLGAARWFFWRDRTPGRNLSADSGVAILSTVPPENRAITDRPPVGTDGKSPQREMAMRSSDGATAVAVRRVLSSVKSVPIEETEIELLVERFVEMRTEMATYESSLARTTPVDASTVRIYVPSYDALGDGFRDRWAEAMREVLGESRWRAVGAACPGAFDLMAANFGRAVQDLQVTSYTIDGVQRYYVKRYMESTEGDKSVGRVSDFAAVYDSFDLTADDLVDGSWSYLRPVVQGLVPTTYEDRREHRR